jgi:hypothetical protein
MVEGSIENLLIPINEFEKTFKVDKRRICKPKNIDLVGKQNLKKANIL